MKSTWPMPASRVGDPTRPISHLLVLGFRVGRNANFSIHVGATQTLAFLDTNMLVSPTQNSRVGGIAQREAPTQGVMHCSGI